MRTQVVADYTFLYMRGAHLTQSMSENVKITRAETMSQNFRHIVISTHQSVEMCRAETMCTFSLRKKFVKKCDIRTDGRTDGQSLLEDASRIKNQKIKNLLPTFFELYHFAGLG